MDRRANIFQNLNGAVGDVEIRFSADDAFVQNTAFQTNPLIIHGNGGSKVYIAINCCILYLNVKIGSKVALNSLGNYLSKSWNPKNGCISCKENKISLDNIGTNEWPLLLIGIFVTHKTPFFPEFFEHILELNYPKERIHLFLYNSESYHSKDVQTFIDQFRDKYRGIKVFASNENRKEWEARNSALYSPLIKIIIILINISHLVMNV